MHIYNINTQYKTSFHKLSSVLGGLEIAVVTIQIKLEWTFVLYCHPFVVLSIVLRQVGLN